MTTTTLDVWDDVIKIGLGATLGIVGSVVGLTITHRQKIKESITQRRQAALESIATDFEKVACATGVRIAHFQTILAMPNKVEEIKKSITKIDPSARECIEKLQEIEARLLLLRLNKITEEIRNYLKVFPPHENWPAPYTQEQYKQIIIELKRLRKSIYEQLASEYNAQL